jgi:hypothetical protein
MVVLVLATRPANSGLSVSMPVSMMAMVTPLPVKPRSCA